MNILLKSFLFFFLFFCGTTSISFAQLIDTPLFRITENSKVGFIDIDGNIIIPPKFIQAGNFSSQLAEARTEGLYGYINKKGEFEIKPQFEFATPFNEEYAIIYQNAKPLVIDKKGTIIVDNSNFVFISKFKNNLALITTHTGKKGFIDTKGSLVIDTVFSNVRNFENDMAIVYGLNNSYNQKSTSKEIKEEVGIIDRKGNFIIPYGKYTEINYFNEGYAIAERTIYDSNNDYVITKFVLNQKAKVILKYEQKNKITMGNHVHSGIIKMNMYKYWIKEESGVTWSGDKSYTAYMDLKGHIFMNNKSADEYGNDFLEDRVFIGEGFSKDRYKLFNKKGERLGNESFTTIQKEGFENGLAIVAQEKKWGILNKKGEFVLKPTFAGINNIQDSLFLFTGGEEKGDFDLEFIQNRTYGIANLKGEIILKPILKEFDRRGFVNGLLLGSLDKEGKQLVYINQEGKTVWQSSNIPKTVTLGLEYFNIDYMNRGYFYANSEKTDGIGGWGSSDNYSKEASDNIKIEKSNSKDSILISIDTEKVVPFAGRYKGRYVYISNISNREIEFNAQDSRLYAKMQALNKDGEWQDIEYLPSSWCGNSYHTMTLKPNHSWSFLTPIYKGDFKTQLRIALIVKENFRDESKSVILYSKPVLGSINLAQFWRKPNYSPGGIMDPYFD
ncbi:hypothetical protein Fleli_0798 [Bernardetia litoralis DSM 6794]|uniref:KWG repeat protein n=1 Tax=Bernardetia litoralis (strain ATCC 23117 / DSM 6794 / NBRC 15988 / NCIMB 1366 / Fx l1 / Sio-4) TaxID=880071 RepID=I4AH22_BERLS|nr:WG repeat-containing protein [Bernardetia litoralis]AFM03257.1 hypothetical protein Fleli_0798 [Bernardetia litoralis DSM 6794]